MNIVDKIQTGDYVMFYADGNMGKTYWGIMSDDNKIIVLSDGKTVEADTVGIINICPSDKMDIRLCPVETYQYVPVRTKK